MRLKAIEKLEWPKIKRSDGYAFAAEIFEDTLILHIFRDGIAYGRYCLSDKGRYMALVDGVWHEYRLHCMLSTYYWSRETIEPNTKADHKIAIDFVDNVIKTGYTSLQGKIYSVEENRSYKKRETAHMRKVERINKSMARVPITGYEFRQWARETVFRDREYMFYNKATDTYLCTSCGKSHKYKKGKHNSYVNCSRTGKTVQIKKLTQRMEVNEELCLMQRLDEDSGIVRFFKATAVWQGAKKELSLYEQIRHVMHNGGGYSRYNGTRTLADEHQQTWWDSNPANKRSGYCFLYPEGIIESVRGTQYEGKGHSLQALAQYGIQLPYNNLLWCHTVVTEKYEYLAKRGLLRLLTEDAKGIYYGGYYGNLQVNGLNDITILGINRQRISRLVTADGGINYLDWLRYEEKMNIYIPDQVIKTLEAANLNPDLCRPFLDRMSAVKISNYILKQAAICKESVVHIVNTWNDYLSMADRLKMNTEADQIFKPKDLYASHQELVNAINRQNAKKEATKLKRKYPEASAVIKTLRKYEWGDDKYTVVAPKGIIDIVAEGRALSHCVGSSERYYDRIAQQESYILFLRKADRPDKPWYTLEVEPGGTIRQKRTTGDKQTPELSEATEFLRAWQKVIKERLSEEEKTLAEKSKALRCEEFKELRKNGNRIHTGALAGKLLADVLEKDLMEATA